MNTDTIRVVLNIVFIILAIASIITYFIVEDFTSLVPCYYREWDDYVFDQITS